MTGWLGGKQKVLQLPARVMRDLEIRRQCMLSLLDMIDQETKGVSIVVKNQQ